MKTFKAKIHGGRTFYAFPAFASFLIFSANFHAEAAGNFSGSAKKDSAQKSISMPSSPSMPSLSMPSLGGESGFYAPGSSDFYYGIQNSAQNSKKQASEDSNTNVSEKKSDSSSALENSSLSNGNSAAVSGTAKNAQANSNLSKNLSALKATGEASSNLLTAGDLSNLSGLGLFGTVSNLLSKPNSANSKSGTDLYQNTAGENFLVNQNSSDSKMLEQILAELSGLKSSNSQNGALRSENTDGFSNPVKNEPKILRFNVNGYDILSSCKKIYFSEQESDGTFLLTGDRKYFSANKSQNETFYFFFNAKGSDGGITKYKVTPAVSQDKENTYSFLYRLTQKNELEAERTGNLVTLRESDGNGWKMDLLISMN